MAIQSFDDLLRQSMQHYHDRDYAAALDLLTSEEQRFPDEAGTILYLRSCMAARSGRRELALTILAEALSRGFWYAEPIMRRTPSWEELQGDQEFERLVAEFHALQGSEPPFPARIVLEPEAGLLEGKRYPLLIALHGNGENARRAAGAWQSVTAMGWILAALQSSQVQMKNTYHWEDQEQALREIKQHSEGLLTGYPVDPDRVVVVGFSLGGELALRAVLEQHIPARGFVLVAPSGPAIEAAASWLSAIDTAGSGLRGAILLGEQDPVAPQAAIKALVEQLNQRGLPCRLELIAGLQHAYPHDNAASLRRALAFILAEDASPGQDQ